MKINKILSVILAVAFMVSAGAGFTTVKAEEVKNTAQTLYKVVPVKDYNKTFGRYIKLETGNEDDVYDYNPLEKQNYVSLSDDITFSTHGVVVEPVVLKDLKKIKGTLNKGTYLVNYEIKPGLYKLHGDGLAIRLSGVSIDRNADTKSFESVDGTAYIRVTKGDFALRLVGDVKATRVK